jgi:RND family efflux transporter MFP subunit
VTAYRSAVLALSVASAGCDQRAQPDAEPPATIANPVKETELATIALSAEAARRLGIETAPVERRAVDRRRVFAGEAIVPPWREAHLTAPRAGYLLPPANHAPPLAGQLVQLGQPLFRIVALPPEGDATRLQEDVTIAEALVSNARNRAERAAQLLRDSVGTPQDFEDAQVALRSAEAQLRGAQARLALVTGAALPDDASLPAIVVNSPVTGVIERVNGVFNTAVNADIEIIEVGALDSLWVKVQLYVGEVASVARSATALVLDPTRPGTGAGRVARPVRGPPSADPLTSTADLYYAVANRDGWLRPHQRVGVSVPLRESETGLVVPWSAVVHDLQGGAWVYVVAGERRYARHRIEVRFVTGSVAALSSGPAPGSLVVTVGAAELFGTEFGVGK